MRIKAPRAPTLYIVGLGTFAQLYDKVMAKTIIFLYSFYFINGMTKIYISLISDFLST